MSCMKASQRLLAALVTFAVKIRRRLLLSFLFSVDAIPNVRIVTFIVTIVSASLIYNYYFRSTKLLPSWSPSASTYTTIAVSLAIVLLPLLSSVSFLPHLGFYHLLGHNNPDSQHVVDLNYYENRHYFEPRPIEPLYYRGGQWRTVRDDKRIRFRGINLPAKTPSHPSHLRSTSTLSDFYASRYNVSFVGRPFPLSEAEQHLGRLSKYGFNLIRLSVTWEAVMHSGPGIIDDEYLVYVRDVVRVASRYGMYVIIDPHQDVWSRFTGGDGVPAWTLEAAGFAVQDAAAGSGSGPIHDAGCAFLHQHYDGGGGGGGSPPTMAWPTNYGRLATATMFTLFFAGDEYAPGVEAVVSSFAGYDDHGESIQHFLRKHYSAFLSAVAEILKDETNVLGFETMNEPSNGFIGVDDLRDLVMPAPFLHAVSGFDSMRLASGEAVDIEYYSAPFVFDSMVTVNANERSCWVDSSRDIWRRVGLYDIDSSTGERRLLRPHYFHRNVTSNDDFVERYMLPFFGEVEQAVTRHNQHFVVYAAPHIDVMNPSTPNAPAALSADRFGWSPHWYDAATLLLKSYSRWFALDVDYKLPVFSPFLIDKAFRRNLHSLKQTGKLSESKGSLHVIVGETGIPFDLETAKAGNLKEQQKARTDDEMASAALDRTIRAMESNNLEYVLWNYVHDNTRVNGDHWNGEDLSIRSDGGNRGLQAAVRPYAFAFGRHGRIVKERFDLYAGQYRLSVEVEACENFPTCSDENGKSCTRSSRSSRTSHDKAVNECVGASFEIFIPSYHFDRSTNLVTFKSTDGEIIETKPLEQKVVWSVNTCQGAELVVSGVAGM